MLSSVDEDELQSGLLLAVWRSLLNLARGVLRRREALNCSATPILRGAQVGRWHAAVEESLPLYVIVKLILIFV